MNYRWCSLVIVCFFFACCVSPASAESSWKFPNLNPFSKKTTTSAPPKKSSGLKMPNLIPSWAKKDKTLVHEIVKASSAKFPALDRYLVSLDETFGYGQQKSMDAWWGLDLLEHGLDDM